MKFKDIVIGILLVVAVHVIIFNVGLIARVESLGIEDKNILEYVLFALIHPVPLFISIGFVFGTRRGLKKYKLNGPGDIETNNRDRTIDAIIFILICISCFVTTVLDLSIRYFAYSMLLIPIILEWRNSFVKIYEQHSKEISFATYFFILGLFPIAISNSAFYSQFVYSDVASHNNQLYYVNYKDCNANTYGHYYDLGNTFKYSYYYNDESNKILSIPSSSIETLVLMKPQTSKLTNLMVNDSAHSETIPPAENTIIIQDKSIFQGIIVGIILTLVSIMVGEKIRSFYKRKKIATVQSAFFSNSVSEILEDDQMAKLYVAGTEFNDIKSKKYSEHGYDGIVEAGKEIDKMKKEIEKEIEKKEVFDKILESYQKMKPFELDHTIETSKYVTKAIMEGKFIPLEDQLIYMPGYYSHAAMDFKNKMSSFISGMTALMIYYKHEKSLDYDKHSKALSKAMKKGLEAFANLDTLNKHSDIIRQRRILNLF